MVTGVVIFTVDLLALGGLIINGENVSVLDGCYHGGFKFEILVVAGIIGTCNRIKRMILDGGY